MHFRYTISHFHQNFTTIIRFFLWIVAVYGYLNADTLLSNANESCQSNNRYKSEIQDADRKTSVNADSGENLTSKTKNKQSLR